MFVKLAVLACSIAVSIAAWHGPLAGGKPADLYPAGVSPEACPNYPHCDNPAVAVNPTAPVHGAYAGAWNGAHAGAWNGAYAGAQAGNWNGAHAGSYNAHNNGQWNGNDGAWNDKKSALDKGEYIGDGDYHGEGLAESGAFGPVHYDNAAKNYAGAQNYASAYSHQAHVAKLPAGVDPHTCPNYPFCL